MTVEVIINSTFGSCPVGTWVLEAVYFLLLTNTDSIGEISKITMISAFSLPPKRPFILPKRSLKGGSSVRWHQLLINGGSDGVEALRSSYTANNVTGRRERWAPVRSYWLDSFSRKTASQWTGGVKECENDWDMLLKYYLKCHLLSAANTIFTQIHRTHSLHYCNI